MRFIRASDDRFTFQVGLREKALLFETLNLYPLVPATYPRLSQSTRGEPDENQRLLEEALAGQRAENRKAMFAMLSEPARFRPVESGFQLVLTAAELERLLQVLNDIRVGSWIALGLPAEDEEPEMNEENAASFLAMEVCGHLETVMLAATGEHGSDPTGMA